MLKVKVAYATPVQQVEIPVTVMNDCTAIRAIKQSNILEQFSELDITNLQIGIWGQQVAIDASLNDGDRIEIYRALQIDPKTARRLRAESKS